MPRHTQILAVVALALTVVSARVDARCKTTRSVGTPHPGLSPKTCKTCHLESRSEAATCSVRKVKGATCLGCHLTLRRSIKRARHVHGPVAVGECGVCHASHGGHGRQHLKASGDALCYRCHDRKRIVSGAQHARAGKPCVSCHDPHAGRTYSLLR